MMQLHADPLRALMISITATQQQCYLWGGLRPNARPAAAVPASHKTTAPNFCKIKITQAGDTIDTFTLPNRKPSSPPRGRQTQNSDCFQLDVVEFDTWHGPYATSHPQTGKQVLECLTCSRKHSSSCSFSVMRDASISRSMTTHSVPKTPIHVIYIFHGEGWRRVWYCSHVNFNLVKSSNEAQTPTDSSQAPF